MALLCPLAARKSVPQQVFEAYQLADTLFGVSEFWYEYVACFSEAKYSQHQWKKYADEGRGFALVIDSERLTEDARGEYAPVRILYDKPEQVRKANSTIDHAINIARELNVPKRYLVDFWLSGPAAQSLLLSALRIKDPGQENEKEREWRVLMLRPDRNGAIKGLTAGGLETYYMELRLTPSLLRRVVLGPTCNWSEQEARSFLDEHGFTETIVERDLPCADGATCASLAVPHPPCAQDS